MPPGRNHQGPAGDPSSSGQEGAPPHAQAGSSAEPGGHLWALPPPRTQGESPAAAFRAWSRLPATPRKESRARAMAIPLASPPAHGKSGSSRGLIRHLPSQAPCSNVPGTQFFGPRSRGLGGPRSRARRVGSRPPEQEKDRHRHPPPTIHPRRSRQSLRPSCTVPETRPLPARRKRMPGRFTSGGKRPFSPA